MVAGQSPIVVAGHVCLDVIPAFLPRESSEGPAFRPGHLIHVGAAVRSTGGAVSNTGLALHRLGTPVRLIGKIGDDLFGEEILRLFRSQSPELAEGMVRVAGEVTSYSIVINPPGVDRTFLHCPGANDTFEASDVPSGSLSGASLFHFGYPPLMRRIRENQGEELVKLLTRVRGEGLTVSLDLCMVDPDSEPGRADWDGILKRTLPLVDFFCPSVDELLYMLDRPAYERAEAEGGFTPQRHVNREMLRQLAERCLQYGAAVVAIKLGDQGLYLRGTSDEMRLRSAGKAVDPVRVSEWTDCEFYSPCYKANVVGTTGSGDCTIAGLLAALIRGEPPQDILRSAVATGAASVEAPDAVSGVPHWNVLEQRIANGWDMQQGIIKF
ncbi:MAG TPA: carbohydrate kinase family protein [Planctomicrobium sp.]|nr:carbohydrate kinase family protein [Planctomicrobium sp.]